MIYVVDPGEVCGYVFITHSGELIAQDENQPYTTVAGVEMQLRAMVSKERPIVVAERYFFTASSHKMSRQYAALETIGALRYVATAAGAEFYLQDRNRKNVAQPEDLKRLGWWKPTPGGHANDAARHAYLAFLQHGNDEAVQKLLARVN